VAGGEAFDDNVGAGCEPSELLAASVRAKVAGDAALVDVASQPAEAALWARLVAGKGWLSPARIAFGRLDFDDVGAKVG